jgi:hypothetical protein
VQVFDPRPDADDRRDPERLKQTYLEQTNVNEPFREIAQFFASVEYVHVAPQLVRDAERYAGRERDPFGGDLLEQIVATPKMKRDPRLRRIEEALRLAVPQLTGIATDRDAKGRPHVRGKYQHWRPAGAWQAEDQSSDGMLRLMSLLWASLDGSGPLLLEEPDMSLHPGVVRFLPQMFARLQRRTKRQIMLSTHSPDLLSGLDGDDAFVRHAVILLGMSRRTLSYGPMDRPPSRRLTSRRLAATCARARRSTSNGEDASGP